VPPGNGIAPFNDDAAEPAVRSRSRPLTFRTARCRKLLLHPMMVGLLLSAAWRTWRLSVRGQTFERPPAGVRDSDASKLDLQAVLLHGLNPYRCESALDEIGHCLKLEPAGKQSIHVAAIRRLGQHFKHLTMFSG
jgi:hypothetical protein